MARPLKIGVVGVPFVTFQRYLGVRTRCLPGTTAEATRELAAWLNGKSAGRFKVENLGELHDLDLPEDSRKAEEVLNALGARLRQQAEKYDLLLLVGGSHVGAYPLYHLPGRVLRLDQHHDRDHFGNEDAPHFGNYVDFVNWNELKGGKDVESFGGPGMPGLNAKKAAAFKGGLLDLDLDAFKADYGLLNPSVAGHYGEGKLSFKDATLAVRAAAPKAVGFFEYDYNSDLRKRGASRGRGMRFMRMLALEAVKARMKAGARAQ